MGFIGVVVYSREEVRNPAEIAQEECIECCLVQNNKADDWQTLEDENETDWKLLLKKIYNRDESMGKLVQVKLAQVTCASGASAVELCREADQVNENHKIGKPVKENLNETVGESVQQEVKNGNEMVGESVQQEVKNGNEMVGESVQQEVKNGNEMVGESVQQEVKNGNEMVGESVQQEVKNGNEMVEELEVDAGELVKENRNETKEESVQENPENEIKKIQDHLRPLQEEHGKINKTDLFRKMIRYKNAVNKSSSNILVNLW